MTDDEVLEIYRPWVSFIAELCGPACEVVLHKVSDPEHSVVAIENGHHSGRRIGSPLTDLARDILDRGLYKTQDYIANYNGSSKGRNFNSSTFFIKNRDRLVGLLCVNRDVSVALETESLLRRLMQQYNLTVSEGTGYSETLNSDTDVDAMLSNLVHTAIVEYGVLPSRMSLKEKVAIVHKLKDQGVLKMKGAISEIAKQLEISEPTVYRYINRNS